MFNMNFSWTQLARCLVLVLFYQQFTQSKAVSQQSRNGAMKYQYEGDNKKDALVAFMRNPSKPAAVKAKEQEWSEVDSEVVHLTASNFDPVVKEEQSLLVMFYAPWCGHCKKIKPEYERAAARMKAEGIPGMMAAVDATKETSIADRFSVKGYPTLKYFTYGEHKFDVNLREAGKIVEFMRHPKEPPPPPPPEKPWTEEETAVVHLTEENFKSFLKKKRHALVMFYAPWCGHCKKAKPEFSKAAAHFSDDPKVEFAAVDCTVQQSVCAAHDIGGYPTIKYFNYLNKNVKPYNSGRTAEDFIAFMTDPEEPISSRNGQQIASGAVLHLTDANFKKELASRWVLVMFSAPWCKTCKEIRPDFHQIAGDLKDEGFWCHLAVIDCSFNPIVTEDHDITAFPTYKLFWNGNHVADYTGKIGKNDIKTFAAKAKNDLNKEL